MARMPDPAAAFPEPCAPNPKKPWRGLDGNAFHDGRGRFTRHFDFGPGRRRLNRAWRRRRGLVNPFTNHTTGGQQRETCDGQRRL
jgi:hypothetical protein